MQVVYNDLIHLPAPTNDPKIIIMNERPLKTSIAIVTMDEPVTAEPNLGQQMADRGSSRLVVDPTQTLCRNIPQILLPSLHTSPPTVETQILLLVASGNTGFEIVQVPFCCTKITLDNAQ